MELTDEQKKAKDELTRMFNSPLGQKLFKYQVDRIKREGPWTKMHPSEIVL